MKAALYQSKNSHLIWLVSFILILTAEIGYSGNNSNVLFRNLRQTELTFADFNKKNEKKSTSIIIVCLANHTTGFTGDLTFLTRIFQHTQIAVLKWKMMQDLMPSPSINIVQIKIRQIDNEDLSLLIG